MDKPACRSCQFFSKPGVANTAYGLCVRFPVEIEHLDTHWCGEFKPKEDLKFKEPQAPPMKRKP